jgi:polyisoprenoid-binding protein YceI
MRTNFLSIAIMLTISWLAAGAQEKTAYSLDASKSKLQIHVYKEGVFKALAHNHLVIAEKLSGQVRFDSKKIEDSSLSLKVRAGSMMVSPEGESEKDRPDIQATMDSDKVLDIARYPEIEFSSTGVSEVKLTGDGYALVLAGKLRLHGVEKTVRLPIVLHVKDDRLEAQGEMTLLQTDYGIKPIKVGGGAVTVKNELKISYDVVAIR